jgi:nucleoside-diphosphate-sugar epimerase
MTRGSVLITGGGGFVGSHLAEGLGALGFEPVIADRSFDDETLRRLGRFRRIDMTVEDLASAGPVDFMIHGAATTARPEEVGLSVADYLQGELQLLFDTTAAAELMGVRRFVQISSMAVFSARHPGPLDEAAVPDATIPYGTAKRMGEAATACLVAEAGLDAVSVRFGNLYGPHEVSRPTRPRTSLLRRIADMAADGRIVLDTPDMVREWTWVPDLAPCFAALLEAPALPGPVIHMCAPHAYSDRALADVMRRRWPAAIVETAAGAAPAPVRRPMASRYAAFFRDVAWTRAEEAVGRLAERAGS